MRNNVLPVLLVAFLFCLLGVSMSEDTTTKRIKELEKLVIRLESQQEKYEKQTDRRLLQLAEWFDDYNAKSNNSKYHQTYLKTLK